MFNQHMLKKCIPLLIILVLAILLILGYNYLKDPERFPVRVVKVEGQLTHLNQPHIQVIIEPYVSQSFMAVNLDALRQALEADPWVREAHVRRQWPDSVDVDVIEQVPVAYWEENALVNDHGEAFIPPRLPELNLPHWRGPADQLSRVAAMYTTLNTLLVPKDVRIAALSLSARWSWHAVLDSGLSMALGSHDVPQRMARFVDTTKMDLKAPKGVQYVDLRYTNGFVVNQAGR
jgi:cell division protein FtsQ